MSEAGISAPWIQHCSKVDQFFIDDDDVTLDYDDESKTIKLRVKGTDKANSLAKIVRSEVSFGNVTLRVVVVPDNDSEPTLENLLQWAFAGNGIFSGTAVEEEHGGTVTYAVFEPETIQIWNDNIGSCYGVETYTVEQVAKDVLDVDAFICSDLK
jgi:hypothetical protein